MCGLRQFLYHSLFTVTLFVGDHSLPVCQRANGLTSLNSMGGLAPTPFHFVRPEPNWITAEFLCPPRDLALFITLISPSVPVAKFIPSGSVSPNYEPSLAPSPLFSDPPCEYSLWFP